MISPLYDSYDHEDQGDRTIDVHGDSENVTLLGEKGYQSDNIFVPLLVDENHNAGLVFYEEDKGPIYDMEDGHKQLHTFTIN
jgi:hypothetical protein